MKDEACTVRDIELDGPLKIQGFVRVLDVYQDATGGLHLLVLCDADPIVWRLRFQVSVVGVEVEESCLTGLAYVGRWPARSAVVFMHPPTRATDEPWKPHQADMTLVEPT